MARSSGVVPSPGSVVYKGPSALYYQGTTERTKRATVRKPKFTPSTRRLRAPYSLVDFHTGDRASSVGGAERGAHPRGAGAAAAPRTIEAAAADQPGGAAVRPAARRSPTGGVVVVQFLSHWWAQGRRAYSESSATTSEPSPSSSESGNPGISPMVHPGPKLIAMLCASP